MKNIHRLVIPYKDIFTTVYVIKTPLGAMLFDTATTSEDAEEYIIPFLKELNINEDNLKYIFISHNHMDHSGSMRYIMKKYPKAIVISNSPAIMQNLGENKVVMPKDSDVFLDFLKTVSIPGHTLDCCAVLDTRTNTLVSGDSLQAYGIFGSGLWGASIRFPALYMEAIEKLRELNVENILSAHDYYPCSHRARGADEVKTFLDSCIEPMAKIKELILQNPGKSDDEIAGLYNANKNLPTLGGYVVRAVREEDCEFYSAQRLRRDLVGMGVSEGDVLLVHSSYKSLGKLQGGAETFLKVLTDILGSQGTLVFPALSFDKVNRENPCFDKNTTFGCVGYLAEYFRTQFPDVVRSVHATHSCCAWGKYSREITQNHIKDITPVGENSPFSLIPKYKGKILMLGCGLRCNTSMHGVEETAEPPYCMDRTGTVKYILIDGDKVVEQQAYRHNFALDDGRHYIQRYDRIEELLDSGEIKHGYILDAESYLMDADAVWKKGHAKLLEEPMFFVDLPKPKSENPKR